jgi:teichoic acid transport system permease protein
MNSAIKVAKEQIKYFYLIRRLSLYELKSKNKSNYLGMTWEIINPMIQILIYWFVFGTINKRADVSIIEGENVSYISWLIVGFVVWYFFYQATIQGSKSIYTRLAMLSKMNFPMSVVPNFIIFSQFYVHLFLLLITIVILNIMGYTISILYIQIFYFMVATFLLVFAISLITSTLSTIMRDVHMFLNATLRMFLYLTPVLWPISSFIGNDTLVMVMKLNPLYYLVEGYRAALFGTEWYFITNWEYTLYFWLLIIILFIIGSRLHLRFRSYFIDYI